MDVVLTLKKLQDLQGSNPLAALRLYRSRLQQAQANGDTALEAACLYGLVDCAYDTGDFALVSSNLVVAAVYLDSGKSTVKILDASTVHSHHQISQPRKPSNHPLVHQFQSAFPKNKTKPQSLELGHRLPNRWPLSCTHFDQCPQTRKKP
jgi:hypothetical protein